MYEGEEQRKYISVVTFMVLWVFGVLGGRREDENQDIMKDDLCDTGLSAVSLVWMFFGHWVCVYVGVHLAHNSLPPLLIHIIYIFIIY